MPVRLITITAIAFALLAPAAHADAPLAWQHKAASVAQHTWKPACGTFVIRFAPASEGPRLKRLRGWAPFNQCTLYFPAEYVWLGYPEFCTWVLHEGGHGAGHPHAARGIMRAKRTVIREEYTTDNRHYRVRWINADARCLP